MSQPKRDWRVFGPEEVEAADSARRALVGVQGRIRAFINAYPDTILVLEKMNSRYVADRKIQERLGQVNDKFVELLKECASLASQVGAIVHTLEGGKAYETCGTIVQPELGNRAATPGGGEAASNQESPVSDLRTRSKQD